MNKHLMTFRRLYEAVPKWEKGLFIRYACYVLQRLQTVPRWSGHTYIGNLLYHIRAFHPSIVWWEGLKLYAQTEIFAVFTHQLIAWQTCIHTSQRTPVLWCSICLGKSDWAMYDPK